VAAWVLIPKNDKSSLFNFNWTIVKRKRLKCEKLADAEVTPETAITIP
jgi:hypothetical protein